MADRRIEGVPVRGGCRILFQYSMSFRPFQVRAAGRSLGRSPVQHGAWCAGACGLWPEQPRSGGQARVLRFSPQSWSASSTGFMLRPRSIRVYSTRAEPPRTPAADQPAGLHGPQLGGKYLLRYVADGLPLDQRLPLVHDEHERGFHRAGGQWSACLPWRFPPMVSFR